MTNKKMTKDEAEKAAKNWLKSYTFSTHTREENSCLIISRLSDSAVIARFPFEPPRPELIIGDTHRFWNGLSEDLCIAKLKDQTVGTNFNHPYQSQSGSWWSHAEPYTLIDPAEHAKLKKENADLKDEIKGILCKTISPLIG